MDDKGKPFTRIVWTSFLQVGMGRASFSVNNFNCTVVVPRYKPYINMQDYMNNVLKGYFVPTGCQHVNNASSDDFILSPQRGETCLKISVFREKCFMQVLHVQSNNYLQFLELRSEEENKVSVFFITKITLVSYEVESCGMKVGSFTICT